jgi:hypothetical protein
MKKQKITAVILVLILLITGCNTNKDKRTTKQNNPKIEINTSTQNPKGRYVENNVSFPEEIDKYSFIDLSKKNDTLFLYAFTGGDQFSITGYQLNSDSTWEEATPSWLKSLSLTDFWYSGTVFEDSKGNQYLYYRNDKGNLLRSTDGTTYETLNPEGWEDKSKNNKYISPEKIAVLDDGTLVALFSNGELATYNG